MSYTISETLIMRCFFIDAQAPLSYTALIQNRILINKKLGNSFLKAFNQDSSTFRIYSQ